MLVDRKQVVEALRKVVAVVDPNNAVAILQYVCFSDGTLQGTNGITGVVTKAPVMEKAFCIAGDWLLQLLQKLDQDQIDLSIKDNNLYVKAGRHTSKTPTVDAVRYPNLLSCAKDTSPIPCESGMWRAFAEALNLTGEAKQANLRGVGLSKNHVYASDGDRAVRCKWQGAIAQSIILPRESAALIAKHGDPKTFRTGPKSGNVLATYEGFVLLSRLLESKLPFNAIDEMVEASQNCAPNSCVEFPADLIAAAERVRLMGGEGGTGLVSKGGKLRVFREKAGCLAEEELDFPNAPEFSVSVRPDFLQTAIKRTRRCDLSDVMTGHKRCLRFFDCENGIEVHHLLGLFV